MNEEDPLQSVLREWPAPAPSHAMDERVLAAWQAAHRPSLWRRAWTGRVSMPVPVLALALLLIAVLVWFQFRPQHSSQPASVAPRGEGYTTQIETAGFQPLPNGETRVIRSGQTK